MTQFVALTTLTHRPTGALIAPGQVVDLSHLTPDEILLLMDVGAVEMVRETEQRPADDGQEA